MSDVGEWERRALTAEERVRDYEHRISWETTCQSCARLLDSSYEETARREIAEEKLAAIHALAGQAINDILVGEPRLYNFACAVELASRPFRPEEIR